jgi:hypothetical protein
MTTQAIKASEDWAKELLGFPEYSKADNVALNFVGREVKVSPRLQFVICEVLHINCPNKQIVGKVFCMTSQGVKMDGFIEEVNGKYFIDTKCSSFWTDTARATDPSTRFYPSRKPTIYI